MLFVREDRSATVKGVTYPIVSYAYQDDYAHFEVIATDTGVKLNGFTPMLSSQDQIDELFKVIEWAYRNHESLRDNGCSLDQEVLTNELIE